MMLVTLEQARAQLRVDTTDGDADLLLKVKAASRAVLNYIRSSVNAEGFLDSAGEPFEDSNGLALDIPEDVQLATLALVGFLDRNRNSDEDQAFARGYLPAIVCSLLTFYRVPSFA